MNTFYQLVAKVVTTVSTLVVTILITKSFGVEGFGQFTIAMTYAALFYLAVDFGINAITTKELTHDPSLIPHYFKNLVAMRVALSLIVMFLGLFILLFLPYSNFLKIAVTISLFTILNQALFTSATAIFQTLLRYELAAIADIVGAITTLLLVILATYLGGNILLVLISFVLGGFLRILVGYKIISRHTSGFGLSWDFTLWKHLFILALPLGITAVFSQIIANSDKFLISISDLPFGLTHEIASGYYGLAYKIFEVSLVVPAFFVNAAYPIMVKNSHEGPKKLLTTIKKMYFAMLVLSLLAAVTGTVLTPSIIQIFKSGKGDFSQSTQILQILISALPIFYLSAISLWLVITVGKQKLLVIIYGLAAVLNIVLNLIFIPVYGITTAAVTTILTEIFIVSFTTTIGMRTLLKEIKSQLETGNEVLNASRI